MTPEEMRILAWETNFSMLDKNYTGAKTPSKEMTDKILLTGHPVYTGNNVFTESELNDLKKVIDNSINVHLIHPFPQEETNYYDGIYQEENVISWEKNALGNASIGTLDFNNDGLVDNIVIKTRGHAPGYYDEFISNLLEEGYGSRGEFGPVTHPSLEGKTIAYEYKGTEWVKQADIKFIKFIEGVAHEIGYLRPKMSIDDVFKVQN